MVKGAFSRELKVIADGLAPAAASALIAQTAKRVLADAIRKGEASPQYRRVVDKVEGAPEEAVRPDGYILYEFDQMKEIALFALAFAVEKSPIRSGKYARSWFVMVNGARVFPSAIPPGAEIIITNDQPYHRKIHTGSEGFKAYANPGIVEQMRQAVLRRFGNMVSAEVNFVTLSGGYVLKGAPQSTFYKRGIKKGMRRPGRKDTRAGQAMTYPALVISSRWQ